MKYILLITLIFLNARLLAQDTKKITQQNSDLGTTETFEVLKSDKKIKNGSYVKTIGFGKTHTTGYYKNNKKDSLWIDYDFGGNVVVKGNYKDDKRVGLWEYYSRNNQEGKIDFTQNKVIYHKPNKTDSIRYAVINGADTTYTHLDQAPIYKSGEFSKMLPAVMYTRYPYKARLNHITGRVIVSFNIDTAGHVSGYRVRNKLGYGLDDEALRVVQMVDGDWFPAILNNKAVTVEYNYPINFNL